MASDQDIDDNGDTSLSAGTISAILKSIDSILCKIGAIFPWLREWLDRPIIVPGQQKNWWHMGRTGDGKPMMQIVTLSLPFFHPSRPLKNSWKMT